VPDLLEAVLRGPKTDWLFQLITHQLQRTIDAQAGIVKPLVAFAVGSRKFQEMKQVAAAKAAERVPDTIRYAEDYAVNALDVRNTVVERMRQLTQLEFEGFLRPAFRQDEWKLIAVSAAIGGLVGELQVLLLLH
jgi:hypothetical protein